MLGDDIPENAELEEQQFEIIDEAFDLANGLLDSASLAEIKELEEGEKKYLQENDLPEANFYKLLGTIDLEHDDNVGFRQGIMLLVDALTSVQDEHAEIVVAGEDQEHAEIQLVAKSREVLENIPIDEAHEFLLGAKQRMTAS